MKRMDIIEGKDPVKTVWSYIQKSNNKGITIDELYQSLSDVFERTEIDNALSQLNKMYLIDYRKLEDKVVLTKKEILGDLFEEIPCLGCEHLHECHVGGERFSPENCEYFQSWLEKVLKSL